MKKQLVLDSASFLKKHNLNWNVEKKPLTWVAPNGSSKTSPFFGLVRDDNEKFLGISKDIYTVRQNSEVLEALMKIPTASGFELEKAGFIGKGEKVYFFIKNPKGFDINGDEIKRYIFALTSHDRSTDLSFGYSSIVMSCQNQFNRFYANSNFKFRHTESSGEKLENIPGLLTEYIHMQDTVDSAFQKFSKTPVTKTLVKDLKNYLMKLEGPVKDLSTRKQNILTELDDSIKHQMKEKGNNVWGLFNGITYFVNHKKNYSQKKTNANLAGIYIGKGYKMSNMAFDFLTEKLGIEVE